MSPNERKWVLLAVLIIVIGVVVALLYRMDKVPTWVNMMGTLMMGLGAFGAALVAARSQRNEKNG